ncbi:HEPN domain-containing protein [Candidatus Magnetomoraceae bacterium gMMP-15]
MKYKNKCNIIRGLLNELFNIDDQCYNALYLHRIYLNFEELIEYYLFKNKIVVEPDGSYHKMLLRYFMDEISSNVFFYSNLYELFEELRGFRHIFVKRSDIWCFDDVKLSSLKQKLLEQKEQIFQLLEEFFYDS